MKLPSRRQVFKTCESHTAPASLYAMVQPQLLSLRLKGAAMVRLGVLDGRNVASASLHPFTAYVAPGSRLKTGG